MAVATVDTVGITVPIRSYDRKGMTAHAEHLGEPEESWTYRRKLAGGGFCGVGMGDVAWLEASLPKRIGEDNIEGVPVDQVPQLVRDMVGEASEFLDLDLPDGLDAAVYVKRLDLVRDFVGVSIPATLDALSTVPQKGTGVKVRRWADGANGNAETLTIGTRSAWTIRMYDKNAETGGIAERGRLRYEAMLRDDTFGSRWLRPEGEHGVWMAKPYPSTGGRLRWRVPLGRVTQERCDRALRTTFERVGAGRSVAGAQVVADRINNTSGLVVNGKWVELTPRTKKDLTAFLLASAIGIELQFSAPTRRRYAGLAKAMGLHVDKAMFDELFLCRLDLESGEQVLDEAHESEARWF